MGYVEFSEVGSVSLASDSLVTVKPLPGFAGVHESVIVQFVEIELPEGAKDEVSFRIAGQTPVFTTVRENVFGDFPSTNTTDVLFVNAGLTAVRLDSSGNLILDNANRFDHVDRTTSPGAFPSSAEGISVSNSGVGENEVFYLTVIRSPRPNIVGQEVQNVTVLAYSVGIEVKGFTLLDEVPQFAVAEQTTSQVVQPDVSAPCVTGVDYDITHFVAEKSQVTRYEPFRLLVTVKNNGSSSIPDTDLTCTPFVTISIKPTFGSGSFKTITTGHSVRNLKPGQQKEFQLSASLSQFAQEGGYTVRAKLFVNGYCKRNSATGPIVSPFKGTGGAFVDDSSGNNEDTLTVTFVSNDTVKDRPPGPRPRTGGGGSTLQPTTQPTSSQVTCIFDDPISASLYTGLPSEEYQSDFIETVRQACRVAEKIVWERNQVLEVSFSTPYNPDVFVGQTVQVFFKEADLEAQGIVKSVGHTFSVQGAVTTQVVIRASEYVFESVLGATHPDERIDFRQPIELGTDESLTSF